jgi:hypothetical protein
VQQIERGLGVERARVAVGQPRETQIVGDWQRGGGMDIDKDKDIDKEISIDLDIDIDTSIGK